MKGKRKILLALLMALAMLLSVTAVASGDPSGDPPANGLIVKAGETYVVEEDAAFDEIIIDEGGVIEAASGYSLIIVADGEVVRPAAGKLENVELTLQPLDNTYGKYDETGNEEGYSFRFLFNQGGDGPIFIEPALGGASVTEADGYTVFDGSGASVVVNDDRINALAAEDDVIFQNVDITVNGIGVCEYGDAFGAAISAAGPGNVIVRDVDVTTVGAIMSTLNSASGNVLVMDSAFHGYGTAADASGLHSGIPSYSKVQGSLTEVPWVLGLKGTLRATNVIGDANVLYYNNSATCNGWGVYSTDGGATFIVINSRAGYDASQGAEFGSLYGAYVLGLPSWLLGYQADLTGTTDNSYAIVARTGFTIGESSAENLAALADAIAAPAPEPEEGATAEPATIASAAEVWGMFTDNVDLAAIPAQRSLLKARYGIMSHGASGGTFDITGTDIIADNAAILLKQAYMNILLDGTDTIDAPIIIHQQISDDAGIAAYAYDDCWAISTKPFLYNVEASGEPASGAAATLTDMEVAGDIYNTDTNGAYLDITLDGAALTGVISSGQFIHNNASYYLVENPAFDEAQDEVYGNLRYIAVDADGRAYDTQLTMTMFGDPNYHPVYEDDNGDVTMFYAEDSAVYAPEDFVGYAIFYTDAQYASDGTITVCPAVNDPVNVTLVNGAVWNVTGPSYVASLTVDDSSAVNGVITELEDGFLVEPAEGAAPAGDSLAGTYTDGVNTLVIAEDNTFTMDKTGQNLEGEEFVLTVTGFVTEDGEFVIDGLFDGDINLIEMATEEQAAADLASVYAAFQG